MPTLLGLVPPVETSPARPGLTTAPAGHLAPVVELARRCCALLLRPCYDWQQAVVSPAYTPGPAASDSVTDPYILVLVPPRLPGVQEFVFELVQEVETGHWRICYAYGKRLTELADNQLAMASEFLARHTGRGELRPYWK